MILPEPSANNVQNGRTKMLRDFYKSGELFVVVPYETHDKAMLERSRFTPCMTTSGLQGKLRTYVSGNDVVIVNKEVESRVREQG